MPIIESLEDVHVIEETVYILMVDMMDVLLDGIDSKNFEKLRRLLVNSQGVLWLSCSDILDAKRPIYAQAQGLLTTLKQEGFNRRCILLDFGTNTSPWTEDKIPYIVRTFQQSFSYNDDALEIDREYAVKDSMLHVPRFYPDAARDRAWSDSGADPPPVIEAFWQRDRALVWETKPVWLAQ